MLDVQCKIDIFFPNAREFHKTSPVGQNDILRLLEFETSFPLFQISELSKFKCIGFVSVQVRYSV